MRAVVFVIGAVVIGMTQTSLLAAVLLGAVFALLCTDFSD